MIRCTIELLPGGDESRARVIGCVEIANISLLGDMSDYAVVLKKTPPFPGALKAAWRKGLIRHDGQQATDISVAEDEEIMAGKVGHHRTKRGSYDLLYRALKACGLEERLPRGVA